MWSEGRVEVARPVRPILAGLITDGLGLWGFGVLGFVGLWDFASSRCCADHNDDD